jgi:hypothetical protein
MNVHWGCVIGGFIGGGIVALLSFYAGMKAGIRLTLRDQGVIR